MSVVFSGRVQGVGFRFTTCRLAEAFRVTGFVRNLINGDVELVAEGYGDELLELYDEIRNSHLQRYIIGDQLNWSSPTGEFNSFRITY